MSSGLLSGVAVISLILVFTWLVIRGLLKGAKFAITLGFLGAAGLILMFSVFGDRVFPVIKKIIALLPL